MKIDYLPYLRRKVGHDLVLSVGLSVLLVDEKRGKVLLEKRTDNGLYCLPGGSIDLGEKVLDGAKRELFEETGIEDCGRLSLFMVVSGETNHIHYPNGDVTEYCDLVFLGSYDSATYVERHDEESSFVGFVDFADVPEDGKCLGRTGEIIRRYRLGEREVLID